MAKKGFLIEARISALNTEALNRSAKSVADIDGGTLVALGAFADGEFTVTKATSGKGLWMAYNPSEQFTKVGDLYIPRPSADDREYTNLAGRPIDIFKPVEGVDLVAFTEGNLKTGEASKVEVGKYLEQGADGYVVKTTPTADTTSFKIIEVGAMPFPQAGIGMEYVKKILCEVAQN